jgi:hypothetical protein
MGFHDERKEGTGFLHAMHYALHLVVSCYTIYDYTNNNNKPLIQRAIFS